MLPSEDQQEINELVKKLKYDDMRALDLLFEKMYRVIFLFLKKYCYDDEIIKDVIEETFVIVFNKAKGKLYYKNCYNWILKISKYTLFNFIRKFKKEESLDDDEMDIEVFESITSRYEGYVELNLILENLSPFNRELFYLKNYNGLTFNEISKVMKVSKTTIQRRYASLKKLINEVLKDEW